MNSENLSTEVILEKIGKLKEEHSRYDEMSNAIAAKQVFTPQDEMELNTLRKKKLMKKDMISYYENLLKEAH